jgi:hypothetical protein
LFLENEFESFDGVGDFNSDDVLLNANEMIAWLKMNKPDSVEEIDDLVRMIVEFKPHDDRQFGYYGIREVGGQRLIFGWRNTLFVRGDEMVAYLLALLGGLREELESKVRECAA